MDNKARIAIIGAGPAGLSMAWYLRKQGYRDIVLYEARDRVGGMTYTESWGGDHFDLGANYVTKDYKEVRAVAGELGLELMTDDCFQKQISLDVHKRQLNDTNKLVQHDVSDLDFVLGIGKYLVVLAKYREMIDSPGFLGVQRYPELMMSFGDFVETQGLQAVQNLFALPVTAFGYGHISHIPAPYVLKYMTASRFLSMVAIGAGLPTSWPKRFKLGFGHFFDVMAQGMDVRLSSHVHRVERSAAGVKLWSGQEEQPEHFDKLVLALPLDNCLHFLDARPEEQALFSPIKYQQYFMTTALIEDFPQWPVVNEMNNPPTPFLFPARPHTWIFGKQIESSDFTLFYTSVGDRDITEEEIKACILEDLDTFFGLAGQGRFVKWMKHIPWPKYFPHVDVELMNSFQGSGGYYDHLEALQGVDHTFYVGGLVAFELVETIMAYNKALVEDRF